MRYPPLLHSVSEESQSMRMRLQKIPRRVTRQSTLSSPAVTLPLRWPDRPGQQEATQNWQATAMAVVDGVTFHLSARELAALRLCAHCETSCFKSPPIVSQSDLGDVLAAWQPYHEDCHPTDAPDDVSW